METRVYFSIISILLLIICVASNANSQTDGGMNATANEVKDEQAAIAKLRELYAGRDFESGAELGQKLIGRFPQNIELRAWFLANTARNEMSGNEAVEAAKKLVEIKRESAWAWFALATAYIRSARYLQNSSHAEAIAAAETALKLMPDDEEFIFLYASSLLMQKKYDEIYIWLDKNSPKIKDRSRLLYVKAEAEYRQYSDGRVDEANRKSSFENFAKARDLNPNSANANYIYGLYLSSDKRFADALPALRKTAALAPQVAHIRRTYWTAILNGQPKKTEEQRKTEVVADINNFLRLRPDSVNALAAISAFYGRELEMPDKKKAIDEIIVGKFPQSEETERILIEQIRAFNYLGDDKRVDEKRKARLTELLKEFIKRPRHYNEGYFGEVYTKYFYQAKNDKNISNAELSRIAEEIGNRQTFGTAEIFSMIIAGLIDRQMFSEAEEFASAAIEKAKQEIERQRGGERDEKRNRGDLSSINAALHAARGELYFKENRLDEAERDFLQAIELNNAVADFYSNLAQIYEAKNDFVKVEDALTNAFSTFSGQDNPYFGKLKSLYQKRNGNLTDFGEYFEKIKVIERKMRKERILAAEIKDSENAAPFTLKNLESKPISLADFKGKIVVLNIWGTWCAACVMEMPELQELYKKYRNDKGVAILTVNNDGDLKPVKKFMTDRKYDFTVLRDENYLETLGIDAFPTTWFIDREGKISFVKVGASDKLLEEFGWRIEELKKRR